MFLKVKEKLEQIIGQISAASQSRALTVTFVGASVLLLGLVFVKKQYRHQHRYRKHAFGKTAMAHHIY